MLQYGHHEYSRASMQSIDELNNVKIPTTCLSLSVKC